MSLRYGLKVIQKDLIGTLFSIDIEENSIGVRFNEKECSFHSISNNFCKPILHPLSDLTKEIEHDGEKFVPMDSIKKEFGDLKLTIDNNKDLRVSIAPFAYLDLEVIPFIQKLIS